MPGDVLRILSNVFRGLGLVLAAGLMAWPAQAGEALTRRSAEPEPMIRILLLKDLSEITLGLAGRYMLLDPSTGEDVTPSDRPRQLTFRPSGNGLEAAGRVYALDHLRLVPSSYVRVPVRDQERRYRGEVEILRTPQGQLAVVNRLDVEEYIQGVLYHEVSHRWPMAALQAQAVAARSYAFYQMSVNRRNPWDVTNDIYSQVYGGRNSERYRTNLAVRRTRGEVLMYKGKVLPAYFHATCGGATEDARALWKHDDLPPLHGVRCVFCRNSPHYQWKKNFRLADIQEKLKASGRPLGEIREIRVMDRDKSGRIETLELLTRDGGREVVSGKDFRNSVGPNELKSNNYSIVMKGYYADFIGKGWGHGVGLCQWGAQGMASEGYGYRDILEHYYPRAVIVDDRSPDHPARLPPEPPAARRTP